MKLVVRYGEDSVTILERDNSRRYEVAHWLEDEIEADPNLQDTVDNAVRLADSAPEELIRRLYGSVDAWLDEREARRWD